jgi:hypothetical protein
MTVSHLVLHEEPCRTCGQPIWFVREPDTTWTVHHYGCPIAVFTLIVRQPRFAAKLDSLPVQA